MKKKTIPVRKGSYAKAESILPTLPVIFALALIPLIVRLKVIDSGMANGQTSYDFFAYWKVWALYILCSITVISAFWLIKKGKPVFDNRVKLFTLFIAAYTFMCFLSSIFSKDRKTAFLGFASQSEGFFTILSIALITIYTVFFVNSVKKREMAIKALYISAVVVFLIGTLQFLGFDIFRWDIIKAIIVPDKYSDLANGVVYPEDPSFSFRNTIYSTIYNSNVFGTYASMIFALSFTDALYRPSGKKKALPLVVMSMAVFTLIGCYSRGAYLGAAFAALAVVVLSIKRIKINLKEAGVCLICLVVSILLAVIAGGGRVFDRLATVDVTYQDTVTGVNARISDYKVKDNVLSLYFSDNVLVVEKKGETLEFKDKSGNVLSLDYSEKDEGYVINSEGYKDFMVFATKDKLYIKKQNALLNFIITGKSFALADISGNEAHIANPETLLFKGRERMASGRGYIWSRTLPLIKNTVFTGSGPDNFYFTFPQDDYMGKLKFMYNAYMPIDMAHSMYLQIATETGVISLIIFIVLMLWIIISKIKYIQSKDPEKDGIRVSVAAIAVICAYLVCGIFTDANVCTMTVFWPLIGVLFKNDSLEI